MGRITKTQNFPRDKVGISDWDCENTQTFSKSTQTFQHANGRSRSATVSELSLQPEVAGQDDISVVGHHRLQVFNHTEICFHFFHCP